MKVFTEDYAARLSSLRSDRLLQRKLQILESETPPFGLQSIGVQPDGSKAVLTHDDKASTREGI